MHTKPQSVPEHLERTLQKHKLSRTPQREAEKNWSTFQFDLKFRAKRSDDLGSVPWIDCAVIEVRRQKIPALIAELKSINPTEREQEESFDLTANMFVFPTKITGVDHASGSLVQQALFLEEMAKKGLKMSDIANACKQGLFNENEMTDGDDVENGGHTRRANLTPSSNMVA